MMSDFGANIDYGQVGEGEQLVEDGSRVLRAGHLARLRSSTGKDDGDSSGLGRKAGPIQDGNRHHEGMWQTRRAT